MSETSAIRIARDSGVATVTIDRPAQRNALDVPALEQLATTLEDLGADAAVRCVVVTGAGDRAFCAGGDLTGLADTLTAPLPDLTERLVGWSRSALLLHEMPKPTIACVNGAAAGAGMALALSCDLRIASEEARFLTAFARLGLSGDFGGSYLLTRLVGPARARELYLLGEELDAHRALDWGLVNRVVPHPELTRATTAVAMRLGELPTGTAAAMKANLNAAEHESLARIIEREAAAMIELAGTGYTRAASRRVLEGGAPD